MKYSVSRSGSAWAWGVGFLLVGLLSTVATGGEAGGEAPPTSQPTATAPATDADGRSGPGWKLVSDAYQKVRGLKSYQDKLILSYDVRLKDPKAELPMQLPEPTVVEFAWSAPNRFALKSEHCQFVSDGQSLWTYLDYMGKYTKQAAPTSPDESLLRDSAYAGQTFHPVAWAILVRAKSLEAQWPGLRVKSSKEQPDPAGRHVIEGTVELDGMYSDEPIPFSATLDEKLMLRELRLDIRGPVRQVIETQAGDDAESLPELASAEMVWKATDIMTDVDFPEGHFRFTETDDAELVESFDSGRELEEDSELIGEKAPEIAGKLLDGTEFSLSKLDGKIVLLDFWATWCGPCVQAIPHIQELSVQFAGKPVVVVGINRDQPGATDRVRKFLEKKKITFAQFMDESGDVAQAYGVRGIPTTVLIDASGKVQDVHIGFSTGLAGELRNSIELLLKGEPLPVRPAKSKAKRLPEDSTPEPTSQPIDEIEPARLVEGERTNAQFQMWNSKRLDVDGDGKLELVCVSMPAGLAIISSDGASVRRVKLKRSASRMVGDFQPVYVEGKLHWLVGLNRYGAGGRDQKWEVILVADSGETVWEYSPELPKNMSSQAKFAAGDLDGDGRLEYVIGLTTYRMKAVDDNTWRHLGQQGWLVILDDRGKLLSRKRIGQQVDEVMVATPADGGKPVVICFADGRLRRHTYQSIASSAEVSKD